MKAVGLHPEDVELLPKGGGWLLVEFGGKRSRRNRTRRRARACEAIAGAGHAPTMKLFDDPAQEKMIWTVREAGLGATAHVPNKTITWEGWEDAAVPPARLGDYLRDFRKLLDRYDYAGDLYGHFGQGCVHTRIDFDLETHAGIEKFHRFLDDASISSCSYGGSLSGEHGDGQSKAEFLPKMFGDALVRAFRRIQGDLRSAGQDESGQGRRPVPARRRTCGSATTFNPPQPVTYFKYPKDAGVFSRAALRCVGVGNCRQHHHQTMCPSYRVTMEEKHSTRGRARHAVRDAARRRAHRRLARRERQGVARPLPRLQGLQGRLPGARRHGDVQGRVPVALLRGAHAPALGVRFRAHRSLGARRRARAARSSTR